MNLHELINLIYSMPIEEEPVAVNLRKEIEQVYNIKVQKDLKNLAIKLNSKLNKDAIEEIILFLHNHRKKIRGSLVDYTANINNKYNKILVELAEQVAIHLFENGELKTALELLMSDLQLISYNDDYPNLNIQKSLLNWDKEKEDKLNELELLQIKSQPTEHLDNINHSTLNSDSNSNLSNNRIEEPRMLLLEEKKSYLKEEKLYTKINNYLIPNYQLKNLLSQSILSDDEKTLIPITCFLQAEIYNPYSFSYDTISANEWKRLAAHSELTNALYESMATLEKLKTDESTLLGQLNLFCKKLRFNDAKEGLGTEKNAGNGAYTAIIIFNEYYNTLDVEEKQKIPNELREEINLFLGLCHDPNKNYNATGNLATCIATRREKLENLIKKYTTLLCTIACSEKNRAMLIQEAEKQVNLARSLLQKAIVDGSYSGRDNQPITNNLLTYLSIKFIPNSLADLYLLMELTPSEIYQFAKQNDICKEIAQVLSNIEDLVVFIHGSPMDKLEVFFDLTKTMLFPNCCKRIEDIYAILISLDLERFKLVFNFIKAEKLLIWNLNNIVNFLYESYEFISAILEQLSENEIVDLFCTKDVHGNSLFRKFKYHELIIKLFTKLSLENLLILLKKKDLYGYIPLHYLISNTKLIHTILKLVPHPDMIELILTKNILGNTPIAESIDYPETFALFLSFLDTQEILEIMLIKDKYGSNLLRKAIYNATSMRIILENIPKQDRFSYLTEQNALGYDLIFFAKSYPRTLHNILLMLEPQEVISLLKDNTAAPYNLLYCSVNNPELLAFLVNFILSEDYKKILLKTEKFQCSVFQRALINSGSFEYLFQLWPETERLNVVLKKDNYGNSILHLAIQHPNTLIVLLKNLPSQDRIVALKLKSKLDTSLFEEILNTPELFNHFSEFISSNELLLMLKDLSVWTATFRCYLHCNNTIKTLLNFLSYDANLINDLIQLAQPLEFPENKLIIYKIYAKCLEIYFTRNFKDFENKDNNFLNRVNIKFFYNNVTKLIAALERCDENILTQDYFTQLITSNNLGIKKLCQSFKLLITDKTQDMQDFKVFKP